MFAQILDCPECKKRFHYDHSGSIPERITCPLCGANSAAKDFFAIILCPECRKKLKVPLDLLNDPENRCPRCDAPLKPDNTFTDSGDYGSTLVYPQQQQIRFRQRLNAGDVFDKYKIIRLLGKGGMAEVYLAEHILLKQKCAIKLMQKGMESDDPVFAKRFIREAKLTHSFNHPNIVRVFDAGSDFKTGHLFLAMEYVEGESLSELARHKTFSEGELLEIMHAMALALQTLDKAGVVHRDIKPSNIMKTPDGVYKLMDLGIAKSSNNSAGDEMTLTMEQTSIGTPGYASPEQCHSAHDTDIRSDIYCLGATIYHLASGVMPFDGDTPMEIVLKVLQQEPEPLKKYRQDLSFKTLTLIEKMMKKNPAERPQSPDKLLEEIYAENSLLANLKNQWICSLKNIPDWLFRKLVNVSIFSETLKVLIKSIVTLVLFLLILITGVYLYRYARNESMRSMTFENFLRRLFKMEQADQQSAQPPFVPFQTIPRHPDEGHTIRRRSTPDGSWNILYQQIDPKPMNKENLIYSMDFSAPEKSNTSIVRHIPVHWFNNGMLSIDTAPQQLFAKYSKRDPHRAIYNKGQYGYIHLYGLRPANFTVSADFCIDSGDPAVLIQISDYIHLGIRNKQLELTLPASNQRIQFPAEIPCGKWFNIALSLDCHKKKLSVFSGTCILGSFQVPFDSYGTLSIKFQNSTAVPLFSGKISHLTVYNESRDFQSDSRHANFIPMQFSAEPIRTDLGKAREFLNISRRLQKVQNRYGEIKNSNLPYRGEALNYLTLQIKKLEEQNNLKQQIKLSSSKEYSYAATENFKIAFERFLKKYEHNVYNAAARQDLKQLLEMLKNPEVNPNVRVIHPRRNNNSYSLLDIVLSQPDNKDLLDTLLQKHIDVNNCRNSGLPLQILQSGRDDVDGLPPGFIFDMANKKFSNSSVRTGTFYNTTSLKKLLYLAPQLERKDENGRTLMHFAAEANDPELVKQLVYAGFSLGTAPDNRGMTPWQTAMLKGSLHAWKAMEEMQLRTDHTPAMQRQLDFAAALASRNYEQAEQLLQQGADPYQVWFNGLNALQNACASNDKTAVTMLLRNKVDPNKYPDTDRFSQIQSPLYITAERGNPALLRLLLQNGADSEFDEFRNSYYSTADVAQFVVSRIRFDRDHNTIFALLDVLKKHDKKWNINKRYSNHSTLLSSCLFFYATPGIGSNGVDVRYLVGKYLLHNGAKWQQTPNNQRLQALLQDKSPLPEYKMVIPAVDWTQFFKPAARIAMPEPATVQTPSSDTASRPPIQSETSVQTPVLAPVQDSEPDSEQDPMPTPVQKSVQASVPAAKSGTIAGRLLERRQYLEKLKKMPSSDLNTQRQEYVRRQIKSLQKQADIRARVKHASGKIVNIKAAKAFKQKAEAFLKKYPGGTGHTKQYSNDRKKLLSLLSEMTSANIELYDAPAKRKRRLIDLISERRFGSPDKFAYTLMKLDVDVNLSNSGSLYDKFLFFGKEDIDSGTPAPAIRLLRETFPYTVKRLPTGNNYDSSKLRQFLLLAPRINGLREKKRNLLHIAAARNDAELVRDLILAGFKGAKETDGKGLTPWQTALMYGSADALNALKKMDLQTDSTPHQQIQFKFWQSLLKKDLAGVKMYVEQGADINQECHTGLNALQSACVLNDFGSVEFLLEKGASVLYYPIQHNKRSLYNPLQLAVAAGSPQILALLLQRSPGGSYQHKHNIFPDLFTTIIARLPIDETAETIIGLLTAQLKYDRTWNINKSRTPFMSTLLRCATYPAYNDEVRKKVLNFMVKSGADTRISAGRYKFLRKDLRDYFTVQ